MEPTSTSRSSSLPFLLSVLALATAVVSLFLNHGDGTAAQQVVVKDHSVPKKIRAGVLPAPPSSGYDATTLKASGFFVDVFNAIADKAGIEVEYVPIGWETMDLALGEKNVDVLVGPVYQTVERAKSYSFTYPVVTYANVAVVASSSTISTLQDLQRPGLRVAVGRDGFDAEFARKSMPQSKLTFFPTGDKTITLTEVASTRADVAIVDYQTAHEFVAKHSNTRILETAPLDLQNAAFAVHPDKVALLRVLNIGLSSLAVAGGIDLIARDYESNLFWYALLQAPAVMKQ